VHKFVVTLLSSRVFDGCVSPGPFPVVSGDGELFELRAFHDQSAVGMREVESSACIDSLFKSLHPKTCLALMTQRDSDSIEKRERVD
jgi:hypothetical protein